jgi:hypothetical protein
MSIAQEELKAIVVSDTSIMILMTMAIAMIVTDIRDKLKTQNGARFSGPILFVNHIPGKMLRLAFIQSD